MRKWPIIQPVTGDGKKDRFIDSTYSESRGRWVVTLLNGGSLEEKPAHSAEEWINKNIILRPSKKID